LKDKNSYVRKSSAEALKRITGEDFGENYEKWLNWLKKLQK